MNYTSELKHSSEILSIIEGGLEGNTKKVRAYTELLVSKLPDDDHMKHVIKRRLDGSYKNDPVLEGKSMSEHIKTGDKIISEINNASNENKETRWVELSEKQWVSLAWLKEQVQKKYDESYNLPGDISDIRDLGRMDSLRWVLSILGENKK